MMIKNNPILIMKKLKEIKIKEKWKKNKNKKNKCK